MIEMASHGVPLKLQMWDCTEGEGSSIPICQTATLHESLLQIKGLG